MPMYLAYLNLELDIVEERGAGRVPQEMIKSRHGQGISPYPKGIHPKLRDHKMRKTGKLVGAEITQVLRREREGGR